MVRKFQTGLRCITNEKKYLHEEVSYKFPIMKKFMKVISLAIAPVLFLAVSLSMNATTAKTESPAKEKSTDVQDSYNKGKALYDQKKYKEAFPLLLQAAEAGHSDAQMHVGKMYYNGWGVGHNHDTGKEWHKKAAAQGNKESIQKLRNMENKTGSAH